MREGDTPLIDAARHGRLADVEALLSGGADVNESKTNGSSTTALCVAAQEGHVEVVSALLAAGARVNEPKTDGSGITALLLAAQEGHMEVVAALLAAGALLAVADDPALQFAAGHGHVEVVAALLAAGARVDDKDEDGATALYCAASEGHAVVVSALLASGATVDSLWIPPEDPSKTTTPLFAASQVGHVEVLAALLAAGARVEGAKLSDGCTPLWVASSEGHAEVVSALLAAGAEVDSISQEPGDDASKTTPLWIASCEGHAEVVSTLVSAGASIDWSDRDDQVTSLMVAAQQGHVEVLTVLLQAGVTVNQTEDDGRTAMSLACAAGHLTCVKLLSSYGATRTWHAAPDNHITVEEIATDSGHDDVTAWLVESRHWSTPLHHLRIIGATRAREQLRGGADLHAAAAAGGPTPLSLAQALRAAGDASEGSAASLVLAAAEPWGPRTHSLFPAAARTFAAELLLIGHQLSRQPHFAGEEISLVDVWTQLVMPSAVVR